MRKGSFAIFLVLLAFLFTCIPSPAIAALTLSSISDAAPEGGYYYHYYLPEPNLSLILPLEAKASEPVDQPGMRAVVIDFPEFPDTFFVFFVITHYNADKVDIANLTPSQTTSFLQTISAYPENTTSTLVTDLVEDYPMLRVVEAREGNYTEHLVTTYGDSLVFNMMVQHFGSMEPFTAQEIAMQESLLKDALNNAFQTGRSNEYSLPFGGTLTLPEEYYFIVDTLEEDYVYLYIKNNDITEETYTLVALKDKQYENHTVDSLPKEDLHKLMDFNTFTGHNVGSNKKADGFPEDYSVIAFESDPSVPTSHLLTVKDGWGIILSHMHLLPEERESGTISKQSVVTMNMVMSQILGVDESSILPVDGAKSSSSPQESTAFLPLFEESSKVLAFTVPENFHLIYNLEGTNEKICYAYHGENENLFYCLRTLYDSAFYSELFSGEDEEDTREWLLLFSDFLLPTLEDETPQVEIIDYLDGYAIHIVYDDPAIEEVVFFYNRNLVSFFVSSDKAITPEQSSILQTNLVIKDK